jgi:hypothetical protein
MSMLGLSLTQSQKPDALAPSRVPTAYPVVQIVYMGELGAIV